MNVKQVFVNMTLFAKIQMEAMNAYVLLISQVKTVMNINVLASMVVIVPLKMDLSYVIVLEQVILVIFVQMTLMNVKMHLVLMVGA